jgi:quaternary ammonium compound-resistance protein SugE
VLLCAEEGRPAEIAALNRRAGAYEVNIMAWVYLIVAGLLETGWAIGLKYTVGFTRFWPSVFTIAAIAVSMFLLAAAARTIPIGTAYAIWVGIGAVGAVILGIVLFDEPRDLLRLAFVGLLVVSLVGLKLTTRS